MDFGLYEMKIVRNNPSSVKSDPRLTRTNDLSPLGSDLSEVYCILLYSIYPTPLVSNDLLGGSLKRGGGGGGNLHLYGTFKLPQVSDKPI